MFPGLGADGDPRVPAPIQAQSPWPVPVVSAWPRGLWGPKATTSLPGVGGGQPYPGCCGPELGEERQGLEAGGQEKLGGRWLFIAGFAFVPFPAMLLFK